MRSSALHGVTKTFGRKVVLRDLTYSFEAATRYVVSGPSGCGKSTLLNLLAGYVEPDRGRVLRAGTFGYMFQDDKLFSSLTVRQNMTIRLAGLRVPPGSVDEIVEGAVERANIAALIDEPASHLSGGERQRVQLANILVASPDLVLLDEPTSKLDAANGEDIARSIGEMFAEKTVVIVSHDVRGPLGEGATRLILREGALRHEQ